MGLENLNLVYTLMCDDVRVEMGNKISIMGIFQNIMVEKLPISLIKFAVINHWTGSGSYQTEVRILAPDREHQVVSSSPTMVELSPGGYTDNVSFFVNVVFSSPGTYWVQTIADEEIVDEFPLVITDSGTMDNARIPEQVSETIN